MNEIILKEYPKFSFIPPEYARSFTDLTIKNYEHPVSNYGFTRPLSYFISAEYMNKGKVNEFLEGLSNVWAYKDWTRRTDATDDDLVWRDCYKEGKTDEFIDDIRKVLHQYNMSHMYKGRIIHHPLGEVW